MLAGGALSSVGWGWLANRVGSRPMLMPALVVNLLLPVAWLLLPRHLSHASLWCAGLFFAHGIASAGGQIRLATIRVRPDDVHTPRTAWSFGARRMVAFFRKLVSQLSLRFREFK